jgi:hypothetical protein
LAVPLRLKVPALLGLALRELRKLARLVLEWLRSQAL